MINRKFDDGKIFEADSDQELCEKIHASAIFLADQSLQEYLAGFAGRIKDMDGLDIRAWPPEKFIADLLAHGILTKLNDN